MEKLFLEITKVITGNKELLPLLLFLIITIVNQLVATLRAMFVANRAEAAAYITVAVEAVLYSLLVKSLTEQTYLTIIIYALGKIIGTYFANKIENRIAIGIYDVDLYIKDHDKQKILQDRLIEEGFSSTMNIGTISESEVRWSNNVQLKRKDMDRLYEILDELKIKNPTMVVRQAKKVTGKIEERFS